MVDETTIIKKMKERGFRESSRSETGDTVQSITFIAEETEQSPAIYCKVTLVNEHFQLTYLVPYSMNQLVSPDCGSVMDDNYFDMICSRFQTQAKILYKFR